MVNLTLSLIDEIRPNKSLNIPVDNTLSNWVESKLEALTKEELLDKIERKIRKIDPFLLGESRSDSSNPLVQLAFEIYYLFIWIFTPSAKIHKWLDRYQAVKDLIDEGAIDGSTSNRHAEGSIEEEESFYLTLENSNRSSQEAPLPKEGKNEEDPSVVSDASNGLKEMPLFGVKKEIFDSFFPVFGEYTPWIVNYLLPPDVMSFKLEGSSFTLTLNENASGLITQVDSPDLAKFVGGTLNMKQSITGQIERDAIIFTKNDLSIKKGLSFSVDRLSLAEEMVVLNVSNLWFPITYTLDLPKVKSLVTHIVWQRPL